MVMHKNNLLTSDKEVLTLIVIGQNVILKVTLTRTYYMLLFADTLRLIEGQ